ncbi:S9 family peptidase [Deminuibacter soli]|uniref:S9 family peptidase n=1 Tax=Deminuibacter soli TaxID=2291815 RepID=A0A3E1NLM4_9BACT|nr:DPP IV N-terminal domain-containing protein [Deminuibacter soli]RFM28826.1 S9 family peptidase [Deminuibacter soli]
MRKLLLLCCCAVNIVLLHAQTPAAKANYQLAARFSPKKLDKLVFSTSVDAHWLKNSTRFWYMYQTTAGKNWYLVDAAKAEKKPLFDNEKMATALTRIVKDPFDAQHLIIDSIQFTSDHSFRFEVKSSQDVEKKDTSLKKGTPPVKEKKVFYFEYNTDNAALTELKDFKKPKRKPEWASIAPNQQTVVFARRFNLYWMDSANYRKALLNEDDSTIVEHALTTDGVENYAYGDNSNETNVDREKNKNKRKPAYINWSPDSRHFAMVRTDQRRVKDLWVINSIAEPRPTLETYKYHMPGEKEAPEDELLLFDMEAHSEKPVQVQQFKDQDISIWSAPQPAASRDDDYRVQTWLGSNAQFYVSRTSRDLKRIDLLRVEVASGVVTTLVQERMNTYVETRRPALINGGKELVEWSEQDGWAHFYLYDDAGHLKNQITSGSFHCEDIIGVDEAKRVLYFSANGKEPNEDPYYLHFYKVNFDGTGLKLLNPGEFEHAMSMDDSHAFFVDNFSRVNTAPKSALYSADGRKLIDLETTDLSSLMATGYKFPEIFKVKADDGITDLYGVLYKPYDFDSTKKYPVVEYVYPGPQTEAVNKAFSRGADRTDRIAQIGIIVVTVGNRGGNPSRSKWYHNYGYGNLRDYGLADKKAAIEQLADRYHYIDINRVGIHGHSGGGFMSTAAMLVYPDFFKVAVSSSGNHDNSIYNRWWSEKHHGVKETIDEKGDTSFVYAIDKNPDLARNLKGHLMLTTGDIDNNVHPANTIRVVNALIKANKRFDLMLLPGQRHGYGDMQEFFFWGLADYYSKWLLGDFSQPVDIVEMDREQQQGGKK